MNFRACGRGWRRGWRCTTSASGSTSNSVVPDWPSLICWDGELTVHTKRLRKEVTPMAKIMQCDCGHVVRGETDDELVANVQKHAREVHGMEITKEQVLAMAQQA